MMKLLIVAVILPAFLAAPVDERSILDTLGGSIFDLEMLKCDLQIMVDVLGGDPQEAACEDECHNILVEGHVLNYACPLVCHGFQSLLHTLNVTPDPTATTKPCPALGRK